MIFQLRRRLSLVSLAILALCLLLQNVHVQAAGEQKMELDPRHSRDAILENHNRRREQLRKLLEDTKEKVAAHEEGRTLMEDDEYATMKKRVGLYEQKLQKLEGPMDEREIEKLLARQKMRQERFRNVEL